MLVWFRRSIHYGKIPMAAWMLGNGYQKGDYGLPKSRGLGNVWLWNAARWGFDGAKHQVREGDVTQPAPAEEAEAWQVR